MGKEEQIKYCVRSADEDWLTAQALALPSIFQAFIDLMKFTSSGDTPIIKIKCIAWPILTTQPKN